MTTKKSNSLGDIFGRALAAGVGSALKDIKEASEEIEKKVIAGRKKLEAIADELDDIANGK
jgi:hypothetical protein